MLKNGKIARTAAVVVGIALTMSLSACGEPASKAEQERATANLTAWGYTDVKYNAEARNYQAKMGGCPILAEGDPDDLIVRLNNDTQGGNFHLSSFDRNVKWVKENVERLEKHYPGISHCFAAPNAQKD